MGSEQKVGNAQPEQSRGKNKNSKHKKGSSVHSAVDAPGTLLCLAGRCDGCAREHVWLHVSAMVLLSGIYFVGGTCRLPCGAWGVLAPQGQGQGAFLGCPPNDGGPQSTTRARASIYITA